MLRQLFLMVIFPMTLLSSVLNAVEDDHIVITVSDIATGTVPDPASAENLLLKHIRDIVDILEKHAPELTDISSQQRTRMIINGFLQGFNCGLAYISASEAEKLIEADKPAEPRVCPPLLIANGRIIYIRLYSISENFFLELEKYLRTLSSPAEQAAGIVFDLRDCSGYDKINALKLLRLVCPAEELPASESVTPERLFRKPVAVLTGHKTSGSAEFMAEKIRSSHTGLTIGGQTAGKPYCSQLFRLKDGNYLSIPQFPAGIKDFKTCAAQPMIPVKCDFIIGFEDLRGGKSIDKDLCLMRACDLLASLAALKFNFIRDGKPLP
eukprot:TRINITY_DN30758_c0_g1_i3.p1 TRINITY_DN30758_c0_g1~~TRINITY_DN30758_c0_g1_i3.p1  ORF type:complete len:324 (+),score=67.19 TRINITY_DN30758_c0_g1_i3:616-1587(+)